MNCSVRAERRAASREESPVKRAPKASQSRLVPAASKRESISAITKLSKSSGCIEM